jgi:hypothetical protein
MSNTAVPPFQPDLMTPTQLAAVSYLARYSGQTHNLYAYLLRRWFDWCETNALDPLVGIQRAHVEMYIRHLGRCGLMDSSINTMMHGVRGIFRFAHIDGLAASDPASYARLPKVHRDESRVQGLDRLELIRFLQVAQTLSVHHGALAYLLGINALRASASRGGPDRGVRRDAARTPSPAPGRQGQQAGLHAADRPGHTSTRSLPRGTDRRPAGPAPALRQPDQLTRLLPQGPPDRQGRRYPATRQPALAATRPHHQRPRRWGAVA